MSRRERMRWRVARLLNRLPSQCWTGLATWALGDGRWPWAPQGGVCREDADRCGACYCGKLRAEPAPNAPGTVV